MKRLVAAVLFLAAVGVGVASRAGADGVLSDSEAEFVQLYGEAVVCGQLNDYPNETGVVSVLKVISDEEDISWHSAADIVNASVLEYCPQYRDLLQSAGAAE